MKSIARQFLAVIFALFVTSQVFSGLIIKGGFPGFLYATVLLTIGLVIIRPILNVITLPLSIITLGLFSALSILFILFIITKIDPNFIITSFTFKGFKFMTYTIPTFKANFLLSYVLISATIQLVYKLSLAVFES